MSPQSKTSLALGSNVADSKHLQLRPAACLDRISQADCNVMLIAGDGIEQASHVQTVGSVKTSWRTMRIHKNIENSARKLSVVSKSVICRDAKTTNRAHGASSACRTLPSKRYGGHDATFSGTAHPV